MSTLPPLTQRQAEMLEMVGASPNGIRAAVIASVFDISINGATSAMNCLRKRGLIAAVGKQHRSVWVLVERQAAVSAAIKQQMEAERAAKDALEEADDPLLFTRPRIVPASIAPRIVTRGVSSVFDLGYSA